MNYLRFMNTVKTRTVVLKNKPRNASASVLRFLRITMIQFVIHGLYSTCHRLPYTEALFVRFWDSVASLVNALAFGPRDPGFASRPCHYTDTDTDLFTQTCLKKAKCKIATLGKLFTHIASPVLSAARNWQKGVFGLDRFNGLTDWVR